MLTKGTLLYFFDKRFNQCVCVCVQTQDHSETVPYQGCVHFSGWDEQVKKCKERYVILRKDYKTEIHENKEVRFEHKNTLCQNNPDIQDLFMICTLVLDIVVRVYTRRLSVVVLQPSWSSKPRGALCSPRRRSPELTWSKPVLQYSTVLLIHSHSSLAMCKNSKPRLVIFFFKFIS